MTPATASLVEVQASRAATSEGFWSNGHYQNQSFDKHPSVPNQHEGNSMFNSLGTNPTFKRGEHSSNPHLQSNTVECSDWLKHQLSRRAAKDIAREGGIGQRAAEGIKAGRNGLTMAHLVTMCRANPDFRAQFFHFCGGQLEGSPELVANLSKAINAVMQQQGAGA